MSADPMIRQMGRSAVSSFTVQIGCAVSSWFPRAADEPSHRGAADASDRLPANGGMAWNG